MLLALLVVAQSSVAAVNVPTAAAAVRASVVASTPSAHFLPKNAPPVRYPGSSTTSVEGDGSLPTGTVIGVFAGLGLLTTLVGGLVMATSQPMSRCSFICISNQQLGGALTMMAGGAILVLGLIIGAVMGISNAVSDRSTASVPSRPNAAHAEFQQVETSQPSARMEAAMAARGLVPLALAW